MPGPGEKKKKRKKKNSRIITTSVMEFSPCLTGCSRPWSISLTAVGGSMTHAEFKVEVIIFNSSVWRALSILLGEISPVMGRYDALRRIGILLRFLRLNQLNHRTCLRQSRSFLLWGVRWGKWRILVKWTNKIYNYNC